MLRRPHLVGFLVALQCLAAAATASAQVRSRISVTVPKEDAELLINGKAAPTAGASIRNFESEPLDGGRVYDYTFTTRWAPNNYTTLTRTAVVKFRAGDAVIVDLTKENPDDRARIRYVPTPDSIVAQMIKFAAVNANDVVYEPGCGDGRITIAAVKAGARRGVGIDIDPERVDDSRRNVEAAGLAKRIEIRLGDALDIKDLSDATVVFLYMGDEFGALLKPRLWRQLKVGTRVVSHRFKLGDWEPDRTITVMDEEEIPYTLHLWTVTQAIKDKAPK
jgi:uncharacterized protein (TIGR03000 family)